MGRVWGRVFCGVFVLALLAQGAWAQPPVPLQERLKAVMADPAALKAAVAAGRKASFFCAHCHGEDGNSTQPEVPNLAGQNPSYLLEQIRKFGAGERKDQFMEGMMKVLKDEERVQIALYYAEAKVVPGQADPVLSARGKATYARLCLRCHGDQARGAEAVPRLAGQKLPYLQTSLVRYRDRTGERNNPLMAQATASLRNEDIVALGSFLTQLP